LFSLSTSVGNNKASFNLKSIGKAFDADSIVNQLFGKNAGASTGIINLDFHGPSLMFNAGKKTAMAITTRARVVSNIIDIDGKLVGKLNEDFNNDPQLPYTISSDKNMLFSINGWSEYGLSIAHVISDKGPHFLKGGITLKYLSGAGNGYLNIAQFQGTLNNDNAMQAAYLNNTTGKLAMGFGGLRTSDFDVNNLFRRENSGYGGDLGIIYEFRPDFEKYKSGDNNWKRDMNKYKLKLGIALLDIGRISYDKDLGRSGAFDIHITGPERFYLNQLDSLDLDDFKPFFNGKPQYFTADNTNNESSYQVSLPSTLQLNLDYHFSRGFYVNVASQLPLSNTDTKPYNSRYYTSLTITPRYEGRSIGLYVPLNYNKLTNFNAGVSFRLGPLFVGSGSILTSFFGNSKQADFHFGLRFGGLHEKSAKRNVEKNSSTSGG
jgi:hypothetical protein